MFDPKLKEKIYQVGYQIGSFVASFRDGLADSLSYPIGLIKSGFMSAFEAMTAML